MSDVPFKHLLVGVDSTGLAAPAVAQACVLSSTFGARLSLVHAVDVPASLLPGLSSAELDRLQAELLEEGERQAREGIATAMSSVRAQDRADEALEVHVGHPAKVLAERARALGADLILLGRHGRRSVFDFGATARALLSRTHRPIWIQPGPVRPLRRILAAVDLSDHGRRAFELAQALALRLDASVSALHCFVPPAFAYGGPSASSPGPTYVIDRARENAREEYARWTRTLRAPSTRFEPRFVEGDPATRILEAATEHDLVVMGTHGRTGLSRFLVGSVAHAVLKGAKQSLLVVPSPEREFEWQHAELGEAREQPWPTAWVESPT